MDCQCHSVCPFVCFLVCLSVTKKSLRFSVQRKFQRSFHGGPGKPYGYLFSVSSKFQRSFKEVFFFVILFSHTIRGKAFIEINEI